MASASAALMLCVFLSGCGYRSTYEIACDSLTAIASDEQKMNHVKAWIAARLGDRKFVASLRERHELNHGDERFHRYGELDWNYLGLSGELTSLSFNMPLSKSGGWDVDHIDSVSLLHSRTFIIIRLSPAEDFGLDWPVEELARAKSVGPAVWVFCPEVP